MIKESMLLGANPKAPGNAVENEGVEKDVVFCAPVMLKKLKPVFVMLLRNGADVNIQDGNGNTVLSEAVMVYRNDDGYFIETLIANGARIDIANNYGVTTKGLSDTIANYDSKMFFR